MRWLTAIVLFIGLSSLAITVVATNGNEFPEFSVETDEDPPTPVGTYYMLDRNESGDLQAVLFSSPAPPFHINEPVRLAVAWIWINETYLENMTIAVRLGLDSLMSASWQSMVKYHYTGLPPDPGCCDKGINTSFYIATPMASSSAILADVTYGNDTVNLTFPFEPQPARSRLFAELAIPDDVDGLPEMGPASLPMVIYNDGGLSATNIVVDIRYGGRIIKTYAVPLLPAFGNYSLEVPVMPVYGMETLELHLVEGPEEPGLISNMTFIVLPASVLEIGSLELEDTEVVEGSRAKVHVNVRNLGNATVENRSVELLVDDQVVQRIRVDGIIPGGERSFTAQVDPGGPGTHSIVARVAGEELDVQSVAIKVTAETPGPGIVIAVLATLLVTLVTRVARRSR